MSAHKKVLLTGASGFLAVHVLKQLLERGYKVKATVRSQEKADYLTNLFNKYTFETVIVPDIQVAGAFDQILEEDKDITGVLHTASPFFRAKSDPLNELLLPALEGTKNVLKAIKIHAPQVTNVVITSSFAAIMDPAKYRDHSATFNEESWCPVTWEQASTVLELSYTASKKFAEQEFWRFIKEEGVNFKGTTVNPVYIFGPLLQEVKSLDSLNTSSGVVYKNAMASNNDPDFDYTDFTYAWVDVRDVALAHILPLENPKLEGQRLFLNSGFGSTQSILDVANKIPELKGRCPVGKPGTGLSKVDLYYQYNNDKTNKLLGMKFHTFDDCMTDTLESLLELEKKLKK